MQRDILADREVNKGLNPRGQGLKGLKSPPDDVVLRMMKSGSLSFSLQPILHDLGVSLDRDLSLDQHVFFCCFFKTICLLKFQKIKQEHI